MDFKRIELIFLCAFLTLNAFLLFTFSKGNSIQVLDGNSGASIGIESRLKNDKISYEKAGEIANEKSTGYYLSSVTTNFKDNSYIKSGESTPGKIAIEQKNTKQNILKSLENNQQVYQNRDYQYLLTDDPESEKLVLAQGYDGLPFYDESSQLVLEVTGNDGKYYSFGRFSQTHIDAIEALREKQETITEKDAIETLYLANKIPVSSTISDSLLAYTKIFTVRGKNVYIPAWFIWVKDGKENVRVERVNAFSNSIFSTNASDVKEIGF